MNVKINVSNVSVYYQLFSNNELLEIYVEVKSEVNLFKEVLIGNMCHYFNIV